HLTEKIGKLQVAAFVMHVRSHVCDDMTEDIQADQINRAERCRLRPANNRPGERVHFFDGEIELLHQTHDVEYRECADAIGNEVGSVLRTNHAFAEPNISKPGDCIDQLRVNLRGWNNLQQ